MKFMIEILGDGDNFPENKERILNVLNTIYERVKWEDSGYGVVFNENDVKIAWYDIDFDDAA